MSEFLSSDDPQTRLNPGLRAHQAWRRELAVERQADEAQWRAVWKASAPARRRATSSAAGAKRRAAELLRMPAWADLEAIRAIYREAKRLSAATGTEYHVDHIIPLQGRLVSGLHVTGNLQVITAAENAAKSNAYEPC